MSMKKKLILTFLLLLVIVSIVINPMDYINEAFNGITIWATLLLPSLFPFFFFTRLFTSLNLTSEISKVFGKITKKLFNCSGESGYAFFMSIFSGYPVGSKLTADLYSKNIISSYEAKKMVSFTSNSGPMFILGTVGIGMLISKTAGLILLFSHIISAILNGIIFRGKKEVLHYLKKIVVLEEKKKNNILNDCMLNSISSILIVGGYIVICFVLTKVLINLKVISFLSMIFSKITTIPTNTLNAIFSGILEVTRGCLNISSLEIPLMTKTIICSFLISFGGISTGLQSMAFLKDCNISYFHYFSRKTTQAILSILITIILCLIFY